MTRFIRANVLSATLICGCVSDSYTIRRSIISQTNAIRARNRLASVSPDRKLDRAAERYARYMARKHKFGHQVDGRSPGQRVERAGYDYTLVCENVGWLHPGSHPLDESDVAQHFVTGWFDSPGHRRNMLHRDVVHIGTGLAWSDRHDTYFAVQVFGRPSW